MQPHRYNIRILTTEYNPFDGVTDGDYDREHADYCELQDDTTADTLEEVAAILHESRANVFRGETNGEYLGDVDSHVVDWSRGVHADVHAWVTDHHGDPITTIEAALLDGKLEVGA